MMKLAWLTDIHLNLLDFSQRKAFYNTILDAQLDVLLCSGDIAEADSIESILREMAQELQKPIYFVLGNHDYYKGRIDEVRKKMISLTEEEPFINWLPATGPQMLGSICIVGQDGWADGRLGDYQNSKSTLNDSKMIEDLFEAKSISMSQLINKMQQLADNDSTSLGQNLISAIKKNPQKIIILTHIPPFKESCLYKGKASPVGYLPYYCSKSTGDILLSIATNNPAIDFLALCGHTHNESFYKPIDNLVVRVGGSKYSQPQINEIFEV
jgi:predicted MPP superfamily phosphohydrolase